MSASDLRDFRLVTHYWIDDKAVTKRSMRSLKRHLNFKFCFTYFIDPVA